jgi:sulfur-carrier protein
MAIEVRVPTILRPYTKDEKVVTVQGSTIAEVIDDLERQYPGIGGRILDDSGELRRFVNVYVNDEDVRFLSGLHTAVADGDTVTVLPAVAGG